MTLKLKPANTQPTQPFSWDNLPVSPSIPSPSDPPGSPPTVWLDSKHMKIFGAEPLRPEVAIVKCPDCEKPVLESAIAEHTERCRLSRTGKKGKASIDTRGKKRKADENEGLDDTTGKKKTKAAKVTKGRIKGPIDLDKNCGVINDKGLPCFRALTCKSHSMGAKRAVEGRSKPFDELVIELLKRNNPNYVEPVKRQTKAERKEKKEKEKAEKKRLAGEAAAAAAAAKAAAGGAPVKKGKKAVSGTAAGTGGVTIAGQVMEDEDENMDDVDSEAELDAMVKAVRTAQSAGMIGKPLAIPCDAGTWFVARRERLRSCKDLLASALAARPTLAAGQARMSIG